MEDTAMRTRIKKTYRTRDFIEERKEEDMGGSSMRRKIKGEMKIRRHCRESRMRRTYGNHFRDKNTRRNEANENALQEGRRLKS